MSSKRRSAPALAVAFTLLLPAAAYAHPAHGDGISAWLVHMLTGWDHIIPLAAAAVLGIVIGTRLLHALRRT